MKNCGQSSEGARGCFLICILAVKSGPYRGYRQPLGLWLLITHPFKPHPILEKRQIVQRRKDAAFLKPTKLT